MNLKALVGAAALSALVASGAAVAYAQDAGQRIKKGSHRAFIRACVRHG